MDTWKPQKGLQQVHSFHVSETQFKAQTGESLPDVQPKVARDWKTSAMISLSAHNHCSGDGATKSQVAVSSVPFARAAAMLCFSDKAKRVSGCLQTKFDGFFAAVRLAFQPQSYCLELLTLSSAEHVCRKSDGTADTI